MWGINHWEPEEVEVTEDILALCRQTFLPAVGHEIECSWVAWSRTDDAWQDVLPVIVRIGGVNYEIYWSKFSSFALTCNTINIDAPFDLYGHSEFKCFWEKNSLPPLQNAVGQRIISIELHEIQKTIKFSSSDASSSNGVTIQQFWLPYAVVLSLESGILSVFNSGDLTWVTDVVEANEPTRSVGL